MSEQDNKKRRFDVSSTPPGNLPPAGSSEERQPNQFGTGAPKTPRKKASNRGTFSADFTPRREPPRAAGPRGTQEVATSAVAATPKASRIVSDEWAKKLPLNKPFERLRLLILLLVFIPFTMFAYWPGLQEMYKAWMTKVDYGHGIFVLPLVALFLYIRLDRYPGTRAGLTWFGLLPILFCFAMRYYAAGQYMDALDQWSLFFWILGLVWFFYGTRVFLWALPSLSFLVFMFQLPFRFEVLMRNHLQAIASQFGAALLQLMNEPAIAIKNTIRLSTEELAVETACSGIRFLISILAIACAAVLFMQRPWWQNILVFLIVIPLALFVNASRIAMTGILLVHHRPFIEKIASKGVSASVTADEIAGTTMAVLSALFFFAFLWYLKRVFRRVEL